MSSGSWISRFFSAWTFWLEPDGACTLSTPGYSLTHCPAGHQVQVAEADVGKLLACPVCGTTFTAGAGGGATALRYADASAGPPIRRPGYTKWLVGLWIAVQFVALINLLGH